MKNLIFAIFSVIVLTSCEGDQGPQGPQGPYIVGTVFEIGGVNFNPGNDFSFLGFYSDYIPAGIEVYSSDIVLIYLLEKVVDGNDVWSLMPQTFYLSGGTMQYNYNHTLQDFEIYLQGNINLTALDPSFTQNQVFRIAVLPADFASSAKIDITNYDSVAAAIKAENPAFEVHRVEK